jgi:predicted O-methyltransferase YrrM
VNPYLGKQETEILVSLIASVEPRTMFEFGVQAGRTAKTLLDRVPSLQRYIGIDVPFDHMPTLACQKSEVPITPGVFASEDPRFFTLIYEGGSQLLSADQLEPCDAVFIDGDHSRAAVLHDSAVAQWIVREGGIIVWHDYGNPAVEVTQALDELIENGWPIIVVENSWLAYRRFNQ